ncbi:MAG: hypothetical protein EOP83_00035 [Verrucomicrobiaceae bacterium]|nr:MAG: hypothetical protein EOP83_00035 [Verrucomicrobiaceae bacterium]
MSRILIIAALVAPLYGDDLLNSSFDLAPFSSGWATTGTVSASPSIIGDAGNSALISNGGGIHQDFAASQGYSNFQLTIAFRCGNPGSVADRFRLRGDNNSGDIVTLRPTASGIDRFSGTWGSALAFPLTAGTTYYLRVTGSNFADSNGSYTVGLSADGVNFTSSGPITAFHGGAARIETLRFDTTSSAGFTVDRVVLVSSDPPPAPDKVVNISGVYPHLAMTNTHQECGVGAVVPWAGKLWTMTYGPHIPNGGSDKLYEIAPDLSRVIRSESVGGTPANRFIHTASNQLNIGPYFIDANRNVRVLRPPGATSGVTQGRFTATAAHLTDPNRLYIFTMEDGLYDVNATDLTYITRYPDVQSGGDRMLFGYHGKGAYTGQGLLAVANNGRVNNQSVPTGESGVLATWNGTTVSGNGGSYLATNDPNTSDPSPNPVAAQTDYVAGWKQISKTQHCEVTGPDGIYGNSSSTDPVWSTGFDAKSVMLHVMEGQQWNLWRLPKASYTHDGSHGWHTEWPRIRQLDPSDPQSMYLMHMHGLFFDFPKNFSAANFAGLKPISSYYKMPTDYCMFEGRIVMGKADASQFNNPLALKDQSNLWFGQMSDIENWGAPTGHGSVWLNEAVTANQTSDPFFIDGFPQRTLHLRNSGANAVSVEIQTSNGTPTWSAVRSINVPANSYVSEIVSGLTAPWVRLRVASATSNLTAFFHMNSPYPHLTPASVGSNEFAALADIRDPRSVSDGVIRVMNDSSLPLEFASSRASSSGAVSTHRYHRIGGDLELKDVANPTAESSLRSGAALSQSYGSDGGLTFTTGSDAASAWLKQGTTATFRLPKLDRLYEAPFAAGWARAAREAVTERQLLNFHGTFYEYPRDVSGGIRKMRALATHGKRITDFASWRGLLVLTGVLDDAPASNKLVRNPDGTAALWLGEIDDLWRMGEPRGKGGPWSNTAVTANTASDPYLMYGYDRKELTLTTTNATTITVEVDFLADNTWSTYQTFNLSAGQALNHVFPVGFHAHWVRVKSSAATTATAQFIYGPADTRDAFLDWSRDNHLATGSGRAMVAEGDSDGDGLSNLGEFVFGTDPQGPSTNPVRAAGGSVEFLVRDLQPSNGIGCELESSLTLENSWTPRPELKVVAVDQSGVPAGFTRVRYQLEPGHEKFFVRARASLLAEFE